MTRTRRLLPVLVWLWMSATGCLDSRKGTVGATADAAETETGTPDVGDAGPDADAGPPGPCDDVPALKDVAFVDPSFGSHLVMASSGAIAFAEPLVNGGFEVVVLDPDAVERSRIATDSVAGLALTGGGEALGIDTGARVDVFRVGDGDGDGPSWSADYTSMALFDVYEGPSGPGFWVCDFGMPVLDGYSGANLLVVDAEGDRTSSLYCPSAAVAGDLLFAPLGTSAVRLRPGRTEPQELGSYVPPLGGGGIAVAPGGEVAAWVNVGAEMVYWREDVGAQTVTGAAPFIVLRDAIVLGSPAVGGTELLDVASGERATLEGPVNSWVSSAGGRALLWRSIGGACSGESCDVWRAVLPGAPEKLATTGNPTTAFIRDDGLAVISDADGTRIVAPDGATPWSRAGRVSGTVAEVHDGLLVPVSGGAQSTIVLVDPVTGASKDIFDGHDPQIQVDASGCRVAIEYGVIGGVPNGIAVGAAPTFGD